MLNHGRSIRPVENAAEQLENNILKGSILAINRNVFANIVQLRLGCPINEEI